MQSLHNASRKLFALSLLSWVRLDFLNESVALLDRDQRRSSSARRGGERPGTHPDHRHADDLQMRQVQRHNLTPVL
jgi:hypothetical protein